ncbi:MAG: hypothetical protein QM645_14190 [Asticcacaulis sp.]
MTDINTDTPIPVAAIPPLPTATGCASSDLPLPEDALPSRLRTLTFASGHVIYGDDRAIEFLEAMLDLYDKEALMLRRKIDNLSRANAADDAEEIKRGMAHALT